jgi:gluconolactonase
VLFMMQKHTMAKDRNVKFTALIASEMPRRIATGFRFTEGPVWHPDGYLLFSDIPADRIYRWRPDGAVAVWRAPSGNANGLTLDHQRRVIACEHGNRRVSRTEVDGTITTLAACYDGKRLNSPNDVVVARDGTILFTDPPYGITPEQQEQPHNGVYRLLPDGTLELLVADFERPNGLAFAPDQSVLYIGDSERRHVRAFDRRPDGTLTNGRLFADMHHPQPGAPDGLKIDVIGNVYVTGATGVWIFAPDGACVGIVHTPELPSNCAWGDNDRQTLYITAQTSVYRIRTHVPGLPLTHR